MTLTTANNALPDKITIKIRIESRVLVYLMIPEYVLAIIKLIILTITTRIKARGSLSNSFFGILKLNLNKKAKTREKEMMNVSNRKIIHLGVFARNIRIDFFDKVKIKLK